MTHDPLPTSAATPNPAYVTLPMTLAQRIFCPCPPNERPRSWYACNGDDDPTRGLTCSNDQCTNGDHSRRVPCDNPWHSLPPDVRRAILDAR